MVCLLKKSHKTIDDCLRSWKVYTPIMKQPLFAIERGSIKKRFPVRAVVYFRANKSPVLRSGWIGNKWRERQFYLEWAAPFLAGLDECVFDEQSWERGTTSACHKSKRDFYYIEKKGKYVVRLYFLGAWRRILVDDMIPVNKKKTPLLPRTGNDFELWPMLLAKALLKLCSLTWTDYYEIVDFHPVACLTGKIMLNNCLSKITG
ncbi:hypothetical protein K0M31_016661 [Melipona bicolor]|uniref:Calpain catalytic domain-containing protein n=1 Tax=Melipona bicolor TaxID=60889 RepID=A0AA40KEJ4_9HYME|nr:hypothetical protein K0M31_016661 [Melipona bicolor]